MTSAYYLLDCLIAIAIPSLMIWGYRAGRVSRAVWMLFWIGCAIGSTWEFALHLNKDAADPVIEMLTPFPIAAILHPILHTFWDGGLFIVGLALVFLFSASPRMARFSWKELGIMVAWGQAQELAVELSGTFVGAWTYADGHWWNPVLFDFSNGRITLVPQLVWLAASVIYYFICLGVLNAERGEDGSEPAITLRMT